MLKNRVYLLLLLVVVAIPVSAQMTGWLTFSNTSSMSTVDEGPFSFSNDASFKGEAGWFRFANVAHWLTPHFGWFSFRSVSSHQDVDAGYFTFVAEVKEIDEDVPDYFFFIMFGAMVFLAVAAIVFVGLSWQKRSNRL